MPIFYCARRTGTGRGSIIERPKPLRRPRSSESAASALGSNSAASGEAGSGSGEWATAPVICLPLYLLPITILWSNLVTARLDRQGAGRRRGGAGQRHPGGAGRDGGVHRLGVRAARQPLVERADPAHRPARQPCARRHARHRSHDPARRRLPALPEEISGTTALTAAQLAAGACLALAILVLMEIDKALRGRSTRCAPERRQLAADLA